MSIRSTMHRSTAGLGRIPSVSAGYGRRSALSAIIAAALVGFCLWACAPQAVHYTLDRKLSVEADSLFRTGNYEYAIRQYSKIRDEFPKTAAGANAQYMLGIIHVHYDNPFADYDAALREFKRFKRLHPDDRRIDNAKNWIRILTVLHDFAMHYEGNKEILTKITERQTATSRSYANLQDAYLTCDAKVDSLRKRIIVLEGNVVALEKIITELEKIR
ncbi:MAG: tetratricopeptide repeat protein [Chitinivibrionales bacterium]|nr:tetratricopeptide repeat protein [Chitinivibrionales bacterium]MBD3357450.1 tetratricopeptide repeat protein [Chitinivibrionales bacterium]